MAITNLLASGTTETTSADVVLADGAAATLMLVGAGSLLVQAKNSTGGYVLLGTVDTAKPVQQVFGPVTFRVVRRLVPVDWAPAGQVAVTRAAGVDMDKA